MTKREREERARVKASAKASAEWREKADVVVDQILALRPHWDRASLVEIPRMFDGCIDGEPGLYGILQRLRAADVDEARFSKFAARRPSAARAAEAMDEKLKSRAALRC